MKKKYGKKGFVHKTCDNMKANVVKGLVYNHSITRAADA